MDNGLAYALLNPPYDVAVERIGVFNEAEIPKSKDAALTKILSDVRDN